MPRNNYVIINTNYRKKYIIYYIPHFFRGKTRIQKTFRIKRIKVAHALNASARIQIQQQKKRGQKEKKMKSKQKTKTTNSIIGHIRTTKS